MEVKELRSVLRDRMVLTAFPDPHAATHRTKLSSPGPRAGESCCLLGGPLQGTEMRHLLGFLFGQMLWEVSIRWCRQGPKSKSISRLAVLPALLQR